MKSIKMSPLVTFKYFKPEDVQLPILKQTVNTFLIHPKDYPEMYDTFYNQLSVFLTKIGPSPAKSAVQDLYNRKLIFIVKHLSSKIKSGMFGGCFFNGDNLVGIGLDLIELDIDPNTGKTDSIDECFYAAYFHYIRAAILLNSADVKRDTKLHADLVTFLYYLLFKIIKYNMLPKQKELLLILASYFFHRFYLGENHKQALEDTYELTNTRLKDEIKTLTKVLERYTKIEEIFKAIIDFNIVNDSPAKLIMMALTTLKPAAFYGMTSSLEYFCALAVVSRYPFSMLSTATSMSKLQMSIENQITPFVNKVKFDVEYIKNVRIK